MKTKTKTKTNTKMTERTTAKPTSTSRISLVAAVTVMLAGLIPATWLLAASNAEQGAEDYPASQEQVQQEQQVVPEVTQTVVEPPPDLKVDELASEIVRVLQANGYASLLTTSSAGEDLPPAVLKVLIENEAVLTVVEEPATEQEGN